ncbi:zinc-finger-containing protein [Photobacterium lutimaris]|uniref:Uncharacterized protein n=1 Tax=Photobacterium lutimaris TaxID=388278 RepID=A0A2T3ITV2_9GAMM|nr:zinc-finger-containing protein [Photobacterium lutimaris]PSU31790.1 hypothetical protein C9I99_21640 [Photobacterium lutimaris]TDR72557.1 uncharacterized protein DUF3268 [Photobacterium lutimaris]
MAPAKPRTKWRKAIARQLEFSDLPTENQMAYRQYASVLFDIANSIGITDVTSLTDDFITKSFHILESYKPVTWERDIAMYVCQLLVDHAQQRKSPPFAGAEMSCFECGSTTKMTGERYICPVCDASALCGPNSLPLGIPVRSQIRAERRLLHERLDDLIQNHQVSRRYAYAKLAAIMGINLELTHIGLVCDYGDVATWHNAMDDFPASVGVN